MPNMPEISIEKNEHGRSQFVFKLLSGENLKDCAHAQGLALAASSYAQVAQDLNKTEFKRELAIKNAKEKLGLILPSQVVENFVKNLLSGSTESIIFKGSDRNGYKVISPDSL